MQFLVEKSDERVLADVAEIVEVAGTRIETSVESPSLLVKRPDTTRNLGTLESSEGVLLKKWCYPCVGCGLPMAFLITR